MIKKRILVYNVNWLGDVLFSSAVIRNLRYNFPGSFIASALPQRCYQVLEGNPNIDELIILDEEKYRGIIGTIRFIRLIKSKHFDSVYLLHRSFTRALICFLAAIPERIGYHTRKRARLLTKNLTPPDILKTHRIDYYLGVLERSGIKIRDRHTDFFFGREDERAVELFLKDIDPLKKLLLIGVNPGGNWQLKRWPAQHWAKLIKLLSKEFNCRVLITGSPADRKLAEEIRCLADNIPFIVCGIFDLKKFAALCRRLDLFISADSGPLHIANASSAGKIIGIFGPTDPSITGPYPADKAVVLRNSGGCRIPCYQTDCRDNLCMKNVSAEDVFGAVKELLSKKKA